MPSETIQKVWMDGKLVDSSAAKVSILTYALHYGAGVFEGLRAYDTDRGRAIFRLRDHMVRFCNSAKVIGLKIPYSVDELCQATRELVRANGPKADYIRPIAFFGHGHSIGLNPLGVPSQVAIATVHMGNYLGERQQRFGATMITSSWERPSNRAGASNAKICGFYVNSVLARLEAVQRGADEALMLNSNGTVAEGTGENVFMVKNGILITPDLASSVLEGITRNTVMTLAGDLGYRVREREITRSEMYTADEVYMTGTAAEIVPVKMLDSRIIGKGGPGPITRKLQDEFSRLTSGRNDKYLDWLDAI